MAEMPFPVIAVDGTAASGKSTFSRSLAERLGFTYINTGAMYRGVTWYLFQHGVALNDPAAVARALAAAGVETGLVNGELSFRVAGIDPLPYAREARVNEGVSLVAQVPEVRKTLVAEQQKLGREAPLVMEGPRHRLGRLSAHALQILPRRQRRRARAAPRPPGRGRRHRAARRIDSSRKTSPLIRVSDAFFIDTSDLTVEEMVRIALRHLATRGPCPQLWAKSPVQADT
ncbi:MAG: (d)CMP kinase [Verrucomicrobiota bacterium]